MFSSVQTMSRRPFIGRTRRRRDQHAQGRRVDEGHASEIDDEDGRPVLDAGKQRFLELREGVDVYLALEGDHGRMRPGS